jgi:hypothetical protein
MSKTMNNIFKMTAASAIFLLGACGGGAEKKNVQAAEEIYQIGVNAYLWRAALETLSFMPITKAEHSSGVVLSDWQVNPRDKNERSKVDIFIVGSKLSAQALKVSLHRQKLQNGVWTDVATRPGSAQQMTNAILMQARILRRSNVNVVD